MIEIQSLGNGKSNTIKTAKSDDDNNNGPGLGACVAVALIAVGLILAPEITLPVLVLAKATQ